MKNDENVHGMDLLFAATRCAPLARAEPIGMSQRAEASAANSQRKRKPGKEKTVNSPYRKGGPYSMPRGGKFFARFSQRPRVAQMFFREQFATPITVAGKTSG
jgi:hypothetical protein